MSRYLLTNIDTQTTQKQKHRLEIALMRVQGVRSVTIRAGRREFAIEYTGMEPHLNLLKEACSSAGFNIERKL